MRRKSTFVLTILPAETSENEVHGSLRSIADGSQDNFSNLAELHTLIRKAIARQDEKATIKTPQIKSNPVQAS